MKNIETFNENKESATKREVQELRTQLNLYKKCLSKIKYDIDHIKKDKYDDGDAVESLLHEIKDDINRLNIR